MIELLWLASERKHLTIEIVREAFSGDHLTPDDMAAVSRTLGQAGVDLADASKFEVVQSAASTVAEGWIQLKTRSASVQNRLQQTREAQRLTRDAAPALLRQMEDADHEMRQIFYSFGFAAREHLARAERLLAHPSEESFEHLIADSEIRSRIQYLQILPNLVRQVRVLEQKAAAAYRKWRQALAQANSDGYRIEFRKLDRKLQQTFPKFCYQAHVIQEMIATAQNIAAKFQTSERVLQRARQSCDSVCHMPLVDVERQTVEGMEEFVRMPSEVFLRNCSQLRTVETRFQQARCELIQDHLHLVASLAGTYSNRGLTLPELIQKGIFGLLRAVEKFGSRRESTFSTHAAFWIRKSIRDALAAQPRPERSPPPPGASENQPSSVSASAGDRPVSAKPAEALHPGSQPDEHP